VALAVDYQQKKLTKLPTHWSLVFVSKENELGYKKEKKEELKVL
jgi:hypothetical protein